MNENEKSSPLPAVLLVVTVLAVAVALFVGAGVWEPVKPAVAKVQPVDRKPAAPRFQLGEIVKAKASHKTFVIAATPEIAATAERFLLAGDVDGFGQLLDEKLICGSEPTDRLRVIGFDADPEITRRLGCDKTWVQVRYVDGTYEGVAGWADTKALTR